MGLLLRTGGPGDLPFVRELAGEAFGLYGDYERMLPEWAAVEGVETTVAEEDGRKVGLSMLAIFAEPGRARRPVADLLAIAVSTSCRGRGIGRRLLDQALARARARAASLPGLALQLTVAEGNAAARRLFESAGFRYLPRGEGRYPLGQRALRMRLDL